MLLGLFMVKGSDGRIKVELQYCISCDEVER